MPRPPNPQRSPPLAQGGATDTDFDAGNDGISPLANIFTEDIDQAILHFSAAVKEQNRPIITRTVLFMNEVLASTAWREKRYREEEESVYAMQSGMGGRGHGGLSAGPPYPSGLQSEGPSLTQWVDALESLTVAGLPTALKYLRDLYQGSTSWSQEDRRCSLAVLNLVFFILVMCRQTQRRVASLRQHHQRQAIQQQQRASGVTSPDSTFTSTLFQASPATPPVHLLSGEGRSLDVLHARIESLGRAQQTIVVPYLCFIAWNAEAQLQAVKTRASVRIKGMPSLSELPQVPLYLSEHDGWIWVWLTATLFSTLSLQNTADAQQTPMSNARATASTTVPTPSSPGRASGATASAGSAPLSATPRSLGLEVNALATDRAPNPASLPLSSARPDSTLLSGTSAAATITVQSSPRPSRLQGANGGGGGAASSVDDAFSGNGGSGAPRSTQPIRSAATRLLLQMSTQDSGELYMHKMLSIMLSSFELYLHLWIRGQPVVGDLFREWTQRVVHSRLSPHVASLSSLYALFDLIQNESLEELTRVVVTLDDVVVHTSFLFFASAQPFLQLNQLLEQLVPLQVTLLLTYQLHPEAHRGAGDDDDDGEMVGSYRFPEDMDEANSNGARSRWTGRRRTHVHEVCAGAVLRYCTAVSQLLAHVAELFLEPYTQRVSDSDAFQLPQSLCYAMLKNTVMFMASEIMLNEDFGVSIRGGGGRSGGSGVGGRDGGRGGGLVMRKQWRWWAVWSNTAYFVCVTGGCLGMLEESDAAVLCHQRRRGVYYVQAISLATEDLYALLQMICSTDVHHSPVAPRTLSLIFLQLRMFIVRLHEEHLAAISLHVASPFSALRDDHFNAFAQLLEHYVAVTAMDNAPLLASSSSLCGTNLLRSAALPTTTPPSPQLLPSYSTPPHRSLWLLAVAYLRLATIESPSTQDGDLDTSKQHPGEQRSDDAKAFARQGVVSTHNFVCATPFASLFYLRDRSYESSEDWMQQPNKWQKNILSRNGTEVPQLRDSAHLFRCYRGEVQQTEDAVRELLLLASMRLLSAALRAASNAKSIKEMELSNISASSFSNLHASPHSEESQAYVYVTAFSRYLCMLKGISSPCLLFLLQSIRDELRDCKEREGSARLSNTSALAGEGANSLGEQDLLEARGFMWGVSLYSV
ncbi:hypothetical protein ABL78_5222 [Leptomonas seymouri]|uniref:Uncharacterized protein n=1 Tax=Leptomonas seymouri TaxID=5684 RepID=A0A0N1PBC0_LEPSE|nr:hypothetical protein ABL78_5222 [Leptomonas seymouri]|eukprot:KPI85735.1 hypothetical protein ABL78_5222 [Leptomonas seymouri]